MDQFEQELIEIGGNPHRAESPRQLQEILRSLLKGTPEPNVVLTRNPLISNLRYYQSITGTGCQGNCVAGKDAWPGCREVPEGLIRGEAQVGMSGVDYVLAETGSLVVSSGTEGTQLASLAPPVHIALYRPSQVAAGIEDIIDWLGAREGEASPAPGRSVVFITGPSRTGDIELNITVGVHGPHKVHAILIGDGWCRPVFVQLHWQMAGRHPNTPRIRPPKRGEPRLSPRLWGRVKRGFVGVRKRY